jgi:hypothetical protein
VSIDILVAAQRHLVGSSSLLALLGSSSDFGPYVFREFQFVDVEGTGEACLVVTSPGPWGAANAHNTARFPTLGIEIYSDVPRDAYRESGYATSRDLVEAIYQIADRLLHYPQGGEIAWSTLRIVSSIRNAGDVQIEAIPQKDGMSRGVCRYEVMLG